MDVLHVDPDGTDGPATREASVAAGVGVQAVDARATTKGNRSGRERETRGERVANGVTSP